MRTGGWVTEFFNDLDSSQMLFSYEKVSKSDDTFEETVNPVY